MAIRWWGHSSGPPPTGPVFQRGARFGGSSRFPSPNAPAVTDPSQLFFVQDAAPDPKNPNSAITQVRCWLQAKSRPPTTQLAENGHLLITASVFGCQHQLLRFKISHSGRVKNTWINLGRDAGIHGNGHMMMWEKNNLEIAASLATGSRRTSRQATSETRAEEQTVATIENGHMMMLEKNHLEIAAFIASCSRTMSSTSQKVSSVERWPPSPLFRAAVYPPVPARTTYRRRENVMKEVLCIRGMGRGGADADGCAPRHRPVLTAA